MRKQGSKNLTEAYFRSDEVTIRDQEALTTSGKADIVQVACLDNYYLPFYFPLTVMEC